MQSIDQFRQKQVFWVPKTSLNLLYYDLYLASKLQIQSIEPNCGSVLGGSLVKLYMPLPQVILDFVDNITVGFKNTNAAQKRDKNDKIDKA